MSKWNVIANPNVPVGMEALYAAQAVADAEARQKAAREASEARRNYDEQIKQSLAAIEAEGKKRQEREAEERNKKERERFEASLKQQFLDANPGFDVLDWDRNKTRIIDEALRARASGQQVDHEKQRLLATGQYGF